MTYILHVEYSLRTAFPRPARQKPTKVRDWFQKEPCSDEWFVKLRKYGSMKFKLPSDRHVTLHIDGVPTYLLGRSLPSCTYRWILLRADDEYEFDTAQGDELQKLRKMVVTETYIL
ncbi:hypothetical protein ONS96_012082 [Cadophora gregata f. sp. sojae]|nr:hypothetical protein ONS96_012082 [Cadophora gregata f. sp. sojae]